MVRDPLLKQRANEESRAVQYYSIQHYLTPGRNTIALAVQSDQVNRLAVYGAVSGESEFLAIPGEASAWRASSESTILGGLHWYDAAYDDLGWEQAQTAKAPGPQSLFAAQDPAVWTEPFRTEAVTAPVGKDEVIFRTSLPAALPGRTGWVRVRGNWHYDVFVGEALAGTGEGPAHVTVLDVTPYLHNAPAQLTVRLHKTYHDELDVLQSSRSSNSTREVPWLALQGRIGGEELSTAAGWSWLTGYHPDWLTGGGEWAPAAAHAVSWPPVDVLVRPGHLRDRRWLEVFWPALLLGRGAAGGDRPGRVPLAAAGLRGCRPSAVPGLLAPLSGAVRGASPGVVAVPLLGM